jgi:cytochrome P450
MMNLIGRENNVVVQNYGPRLKIARRLIHDIFSSRKVEHWGPAIQRERVKLISRLSSNPDDWKGLIQEFVSSFDKLLPIKADA